MKVYAWWGGSLKNPERIGTGYHGGSISVMADNVQDARELAQNYLSVVEYGAQRGHPESVRGEPDAIHEAAGVIDFDSGDCC